MLDKNQEEQTPQTPELRREDKLSATVAAAYDKLAGTPAPEAPALATPAPTATPVPASDRARDERTGKFIHQPEVSAKPAPTKTAASGSAPAVPAPAAPVAPTPAVTPEPAPAPVRDTAPQSWRAPAKALWGKLPAEFAPLKAEVQRLEREREAVQRESARARHAEAEFSDTVEPYREFIEAAGHTPMQSVAELMKTAAALQTLPPWDKAVLVASIARAHGVDPELLGTALMAGPAAASQPSPVPEMRDPRLDAMMEDVRAARELVHDVREAQEAVQAEADTAANTELDDFIAAHPLAGDPDVQLRMARAVDLAWQDGIDLGYDQAYTGVLAVDPELRALDQQQVAAAATNPNGSTARAEAAASSIRPSPVAELPRDLKGQKLENHVAAAYDRVMAARR